jgi:hypothetical protein
MVRNALRQLYIQCRTYISFDRALVRTLGIAGFCAGLLIYDWPFLLSPLHRAMTLAVLVVVISFAAFYELTVRDAPGGAVLAVILSVCGFAGALWLGLTLFYRPLPNDHAPLLPAGERTAGLCPAPEGGMRILVGRDQLLTSGKGPVKGLVTPFRIASCSAPSFRRDARGLMVTGFGYDGDGTVIWELRDNQFARLQGDYLHVHRPDQSSLGLYDKWEREIFFIRYLAPDAVRIRGRFVCGTAPLVTMGGSTIEIGARQLSQPRCLKDSAGGLNYVPGAAGR